nr:uncharacterized protein LOC127323679 [Lolium perenne]
MATSDGGAVERWMMYTKVPLPPIVKKFTGCLIEDEGCNVSVHLVALINGFVYLSIFYYRDTRYAHPYVMAWPPCLVQSKEESETEFIRGSVADDRPVCAEEASTVLVTALKSFRQALMNYSDSNKEIVSELEAFFGPTKIMRALLLEKWLFWMHN